MKKLLAYFLSITVLASTALNANESWSAHTKRSAQETLSSLRDGSSFIASTIGNNVTASNILLASIPVVVAGLSENGLNTNSLKTAAACAAALIAGKKATLYAWNTYCTLGDAKQLADMEQFKILLPTSKQRSQLLQRKEKIITLLENYTQSGLHQFTSSQGEFGDLVRLTPAQLQQELQAVQSRIQHEETTIQPLARRWLLNVSFWNAFKMATHFQANPVQECLWSQSAPRETLRRAYEGFCNGLSQQELARFAAGTLAAQRVVQVDTLRYEA